MNFADAIRQAAKNAASAPKPEPTYVPLELQTGETTMTPEFDSNQNHTEEHAAPQPTAPETNAFEAFAPSTPAFEAEPAVEAQDFAFDAVTSAPVAMPEAPTMTVQTGNVVRLELFLSPEQMSQLFRSIVATQHAMLTLREAAQYLRVHPSTVEAMAHEGRLPGLLIEGRWRFPKSSLDEWLNMQVFKKGEAHAA